MQHTVATGTVQDVERQVIEVVSYMRKDGGYVFNNIHNLLAEVSPEVVLTMYRAAASV
jgi:uroporphyrinogen decarboxylase